MLAEFRDRYPEIELQVQVGNTQQIQHALIEGEIELGLTEGPVDSDELESEVFGQDELVAVAPAGHRFLKKGAVTLREFCCEPIILREEARERAPWLRRLYDTRGSRFFLCYHWPVLKLSKIQSLRVWGSQSFPG